ncbi:MAG: hypothetical protein C0594_11405 [Marinilabiliales bacterium]|nr:MAG: hypothetical protein C0594_11405 [Marinilabiliales bacterium]
MRVLKGILGTLAITGLLFTYGCGGGQVTEDSLNDALNDLEGELNNIEEATEQTEEVPVAEDLFVSEEGNFKVNFPGTPSSESSSVPTEVGNIEMVQFMYEKSATEIYMLAYSDYPTAAVDASNPAELLANAKGGFINEMGMTIEEEKEVKIGENPGIYFKAHAKTDQGNFYATVADYIVKNRLYQVAILRDGSYADADDASSFIDSFELITEE